MSIFLGLGTNQGELERNLRTIIAELDQQAYIDIRRTSSMYRSQPVGHIKQPWFLNMVIEVHSALTPFELLNSLKKLEVKLGRVHTYKWGPRVVDIDILSYDDLILTTDELRIPHPEMHKRKFVLVPLTEIAPYFIHPVDKKSIWEMLQKCPDQCLFFHSEFNHI